MITGASFSEVGGVKKFKDSLEAISITSYERNAVLSDSPNLKTDPSLGAISGFFF